MSATLLLVSFAAGPQVAAGGIDACDDPDESCVSVNPNEAWGDHSSLVKVQVVVNYSSFNIRWCTENNDLVC